MGLGGRRVGRRALTKGVGLAVLALLAIYALLGGDLGELGLDDGTSTTAETTTAESTTTAATESQPTTAEDTSTPAEAPAGFSQEERDGIAATLAAIDSGDLPYEQDGTTFQNREGHLPEREQGYYREYTVVTPGSDDRGARRLVVGAGGDTWYTRDHYDSFVQIDPEQFR